MKHKKYTENEITTCKICAALFLMAKEKAKINHEDILIHRAKEVLNGKIS